MSFLGVDVGTTGCKTTAFSDCGGVLSFAYEEYDVQRPKSGWAELDAGAVWQSVKRTIAKVTAGHPAPSSIRALSVSSMGEAVIPVTNFSLANRTLLFDLSSADWSDYLLDIFLVDRGKLPRASPSATQIGTLSLQLAGELGLPTSVALVSGAHDQCANAVGCGAIENGQAAFGMGTYICITPVYSEPRPARTVLERGLNTEYHAAPGKLVSFIYNPGEALVKWYRDTFALVDHKQAKKAGKSIYDRLFAETLEDPSPVLLLPHFAPTGPPEFIVDSSGVMIGLRLDTTRADVLKGILEGTAYYLKECVDSLSPIGIQIYQRRFEYYKQLWPMMRTFLQALAKESV